jgi:beta-mannosidase
MTRNAIDLIGTWSFAYSVEPPQSELRTAADLAQAGLTACNCQVPGNFELDLHAAGLLGDPFIGMNMADLLPLEKAHVWYWRRFAAPPAGDRQELCFEGLDCYADVYLNGQLVACCDNMLMEQHIPVDGLLQADNELLVHIRPAVVEARQYDYRANLKALQCGVEALYVRKAPHMYGWDIMPRAVSAGIWRPVQLRTLPQEHWRQAYLETQQIAADHSQARLALSFEAALDDAAYNHTYEVALVGECGASRFQQRERMLFQAGSLTFALPDPELWWPKGRGAANLYDCRLTLLKDGQELDTISFRHGVRTVRLERTSTTNEQGDGEFCFWVNGEKVFVHGSNWVPVDAFHSRDASRIPQILEMADDLNCNMLRCWGGNVYEDNLFYDICDEKGIMIWQDFTMACAIYPQDDDFKARLESEARQVVRRLRQHPCIALWAGDNECDASRHWGGRNLDPHENMLTRRVLPDVLRDEDNSRPYIPSSPYVDPEGFKVGDHYLPEYHLWGPRDYFKSDFYYRSLCHFASEIGYHGCPMPESIREFITPDKVWPYQNNEEWLLHAASPVPGVDIWDYRIELMAKQIRELFGVVPDNLEDYAFASQVSQAEAKKFFIELFRVTKWRRTGILWWNLMDGWPQFSDAIVDYYFRQKLAYPFIKRSQESLMVTLAEPGDWVQKVVACNDSRDDLPLTYEVRDVDTDEVVCCGEGTAWADASTTLGTVPYSQGNHRFYVITWQSALGEGKNHYLAGNPPFSLETYRGWLTKAGLLPDRWAK